MDDLHKGGVYDETCATRELLNIITGKWAVLIISLLRKGTMRPSELKRTIGGISDKVLTEQLRKLEASKLLHREVYPVVPPRVEYSLTDSGKSLSEVTLVLCNWATEHVEDILSTDT